MRKYGWRLGFVIIVILLATLSVYFTTVQSAVDVDSTKVRVYRDGLVHVEQRLMIDELSPEASVTLLSATVENLVVLDDDLLAVDYQFTDKNLVIYSLGATQVDVEYDVNTLTSKENEVWTLLLNNPYSLSVYFPINSTIIYLSATPTAINTTGSHLSLSLGSGQWEISYMLQLIAGDDGLSPTDFSQGTSVFPLEYLIVIIAILLVVIIITVLMFNRKRKPNIKKALNSNPQLMKEDKAVLEFLAEKDGKAFEAEIRERFPDMPRTTLWRLIKRLEKLEIVEVKKIGLENQVILKK